MLLLPGKKNQVSKAHLFPCVFVMRQEKVIAAVKVTM